MTKAALGMTKAALGMTNLVLLECLIKVLFYFYRFVERYCEAFEPLGA